MSLKSCVRNKLLNEFKNINNEWKILVLDQLGTKMTSNCLSMTDLTNHYITLVEDITKKRQCVPNLEAIYLMKPTADGVERIFSDFNGDKRLYKKLHILFTEACPDELFNAICNSSAGKYMETLKEINMSFLPYESQVFLLDDEDLFCNYYNTSCNMNRIKLERAAEQLATLCATLGEYPIVRYRSEYTRNMEFAHILQQKLDAYRADDHTMGTLPNKDKSQFLILDRGFDLITPLMHEISLQAFVNEFLPIKDSLFTYEVRNNNVPQKKEFLLNESDNLWVDYRHKPIYFYAKEINKLLKQFSDDKKLKSKKNTSVNDVSQMIKNMPQYQKEMNKYSAHLKIAEISLDKMHSLKNYILYQQNLATGYDVNESKINDPLRYVREMLSDQTLENFDKIKLILLTILSKETITKEVLDRICEHINLSEKEEKIILDFELLGVPIIKRDKNKDVDKERVSILSQFYPNYTTKKPPMTFGVRKAKSYVENDMCRWVPNVKDIVEQAVNEKLDKRKFPILRNISRNFSSGQQAISVRYGQWHNKEQSQKSGLRLIIFIIGGVTFSEIRSIYEIINNNSNNFDIVIGSDMILQHNKIISSIMDLGSVQNN